MELRIGTPVDCSDQICGAVTRVVVDPRSWAATHLVVESAGGHTSARLVSIELVAEAGGRVTLACTETQWCRFPLVEEVRFVDDPASGSWEEFILWPLVGPLGGMDVPVVEEHLPPGEVTILPDDVEATDGPIGPVDGVVIGSDRRLTHILLQEGHLWRRKEVAIPVRSIQTLADEIHITLSKRELTDLPAWRTPPPSA